MQSFEIEIINKLGLHARAAAKLVSVASKFASHVELKKDTKIVNAKSIMGVMMLAAAKGTTLLIEIEGDDEIRATDAIKQIINNRFDELE
jgi:phosphocarrier protein HPr